MERKLTQKQEKFVQGLIKGLSQRQAYRAAYDAKNMSNSTVDSNACRLLKTSKVSARHQELNSKIIKRAEEKLIITAEEILREIASIAKDDLKNYLDFEMKEFVAGYEDGEVLREERIAITMKDSKTIDTKNISEISLGKDGNFKFKLYERDKALYKLAEMFGMDELSKAKQKLAEDRFEHEKDIDSKKYW